MKHGFNNFRSISAPEIRNFAKPNNRFVDRNEEEEEEEVKFERGVKSTNFGGFSQLVNEAGNW